MTSTINPAHNSRRPSLRKMILPDRWARRLRSAVGLVALINAPVLALSIPLIRTNSGIPLFGDMQFPLTANAYSANFTTMWNPHGSQSNLQEIDRLFVMDPLLWMLHTLGLWTPTNVARLILIGVPAAAGLAAYALASRVYVRLLGRRRLVLLIGFAWLYEIGPWVMYSESAYFFLIAYAVTPFLILLVLNFDVQARLWALAPIAAAVCLEVASASPQYTIFVGLVSLLCLLVRLHAIGFRRVSFPSLLFACWYIALSLYWLVPTIELAATTGISPGYELTWSNTVEFSRNASLWNVVTGNSQWLHWWRFPGWWNGVWGALWTIAAGIVPLAALFGLYLRSTPRRIVLGATIAILVLLGMGAKSPLGPTYRWIEFGAPLLSGIGWIFRDPWKIIGFLWLVELVAAGFGLQLLLTPSSRRHYRAYFACAMIAAALLATLPENWYGFYFAYRPVTPPVAYTDIATYLKTAPDPTLWMAPYSSGTVGAAGTIQYTWDRGRQAPFFAPESMPGTVFGDYHYTNLFAQTYTYLTSDLASLPEKLQNLGFRNLVLAHDIVGAGVGYQRLKAALAMSSRVSLVRQTPLADLYVVHRTPPAAPVTVIGGRVAYDALYGLHAAPAGSPLIFAQETMANASALASGALDKDEVDFVDSGLTDYAATVLAPKYARSLVGATSGMSNIYKGWGSTPIAEATSEMTPWHIYLQDFLGVADDWAFDYGLGGAKAARPGAKLPVAASLDPGLYEVLIRSYQSPLGGTIAVAAGAQSWTLNSHASSAGLSWTALGPLTLSRGIRSVTLDDVGGSVAVNSIAFVPLKVWDLEKSKAQTSLSKRPVGSYLLCQYGLTGRKVYLPSGRYSVLGGNMRLTLQGPSGQVQAVGTGSVIESPGGAFDVLRSRGACAQGVGFENRLALSAHRDTPRLTVLRQAYDADWRYTTTRESAGQAALEVNGAEPAASGVTDGGHWSYLPNLLLHRGIVSSIVATIIVTSGTLGYAGILRWRRRGNDS